MRLVVSEEVFSKFPGAVIGVVIAKNIDNAGGNEELTRLVREQEEKIRASFSLETLSENPKIASWREAYRAFGAKPKKHRCSVENLYRMILESDAGGVRSINKLVDAYNLISIKYVIPAGGDDADKVRGDIRLKFAEGSERFVELGSQEPKNPEKGEVVYVDDEDVLCRRWNWRECDKTKMTSETRNAVLVVEGLPPFTRDEVAAIADELAGVVKRFCGGEARALALSREETSAGIS